MDVRMLHQRSEGESNGNGQSVISRAMAMDRCPRCGKDIPASMLLAHAHAEEYLIQLIKQDHPEWVRPDGACPRCKLYYRVLATRTGV